MSALSSVKRLVPESWRQKLRETQVGLSLTHIHGPRAIELAPNEACVTCLVKNGDFYVDHFVEHYSKLGFRHIFFLDNGSTDNTIRCAIRHPNVTVYRSEFFVGGFQGLLKRRLAERAIPSGWCLDVDVDEFFDYPFSERVPLQRFLEYLNGKGYTAVITQMLDMFSARPLSSLGHRQQEPLKEICRYYDISNVVKVPYGQDPLAVQHGSRNQIGSPDAALYWGGIRKSVYGFNCLLTKHSLFQTGRDIELFAHVHFVNGAKLADVSGALRHYKFASNALEEALQGRDAFPAITHFYQAIIDGITKRPNFCLRTGTARELKDTSELLANGFLFSSADYRRHATINSGECSSAEDVCCDRGIPENKHS